MRCFIFFIISIFSLFASAHIRKVVYSDDQILTVKTALGIATIIQLPETIQSAIIGDQSAFKIEYLDKAVTIKPLRGSAKTNLYLLADKKRYNIRLQILTQDSADYIVYILSSFRDGANSQVRWQKSGKSSDANGLILVIERIGISQHDFVLLDLSLKLKTNEFVTIKPEDVWVFQGDNSKTVNSLFLSSTNLTKDKPLKIGVSIARSDLVKGKPIRVELKGSKTNSISISEVALWK